MSKERYTLIKKELYKQKPPARLLMIRNDGIHFLADFETENDGFFNVFFKVPLEEIGDAKFYDKMESQLLIRWIV